MKSNKEIDINLNYTNKMENLKVLRNIRNFLSHYYSLLLAMIFGNASKTLQKRNMFSS